MQEYLQFAHERDRRKIIENHCSQMVVKNMGKTASHIKKAIKDASEYNSHLNQDRKEERSAYFDMQTQVISFYTSGWLLYLLLIGKYVLFKIYSLVIDFQANFLFFLLSKTT